MSRLMFAALLLTSCAAEVAPRAEPGEPRVLPVGATAALDGSFSEGDGLTYAWSVEPEGATILDAASPHREPNPERHQRRPVPPAVTPTIATTPRRHHATTPR